MAQGNYVQTNFLAGEWGKLAQGRMDDPRYKTAMATCLNSIPVQEGSVVRRPGFGRVGHTRNGQHAAIKSFAYTEASSFSVELTDGYARFLEGDGFLYDADVEVSTIVSGLVTTVGDHDFSTDEQVVFHTDEIADVLVMNSLLGRQFRVSVVSATTFQLYDALTGLPVTDSSSPTAAQVRRIHEVVSPYTEAMLDTVRTVQAEDDMVLLNPSMAPRVLTLDTDTEQFSLSVANLKDGPYLDAVSGSLATPSGTTGIISLTLSFSAYEATRAYAIGDFVTSVGIGYRSLIDQNVGNTPASSPTAWEVASPGQAVGPNGFVGSDIGRLVRIYSGGSSWTWGKITGLSTTGLVDRDVAGTSVLGNMTNGGGLEAAFDDIFVATSDLEYARRGGATAAYVGLALPTPTNVSSAVVYEASTGGGNNVHLYLYGNNTAPTASDDGTVLATALNVNGTVTLTSDDNVSTWAYLWVRIANPSGVSVTLQLSEIQFFNTSASPGSAVNVQILGGTLANTSAAVWRLGVYSDTTGWPTCGCYHQGRLFLGGAVKNRWDASKSNDIYNFEPTAAAGTVADNNAIAYYFNATDRNHIFWMRPSQQGVICGTQGGEWVIKASENNNNLTPTSAQAHRVTKYECASAEPVTSGLSTVFIQRHRRRTMEFISDIYSGKWFAPDLNEFSKQVTKSGFEELASIEELAPIVWARRTDGRLVGCTYRRVSMYSAEPPKFLAWHQHTLGHDGVVVSITSGPAADTTLDTLNMVVRDRSSGVHYVEYLRKITEEDDELWAANFLDGSMVPPGGKLVTESGETVLKLYGFAAYEGLDRDVWACGQDLGRFTVSGGVLSIPLTGTLTPAVLARYTTSPTDYESMAVTIRSDVGSTGADQFVVPILVGLSYTSRGQLLRPNRQEDVRTPSGPGFAKEKRSHELHALLHNTRGISFGTRFNKLRPIKLVSDGGRVFDVDEAFSGVYTAPLEDNYSYDSQPCWEVSRPYPATVCAFGAALNTEG